MRVRKKCIYAYHNDLEEKESLVMWMGDGEIAEVTALKRVNKDEI